MNHQKPARCFSLVHFHSSLFSHFLRIFCFLNFFCLLAAALVGGGGGLVAVAELLLPPQKAVVVSVAGAVATAGLVLQNELDRKPRPKASKTTRKTVEGTVST